jgi:DNA polymerase beta
MATLTDHKARIIEILETLKERDLSQNEKWKARAYDNVLKQLKVKEGPITSFDDLKDIKGIGKKIREKIEEILNTGDLKQVHKINEDVSSIMELSKVFGIGPVKARELYETDGIKDINDLRKNEHLLNDKQKMGLKYYDDFEKRIPRIEMEKHDKFIIDAITKIDDKIAVMIMGSYRRGEKNSGDIDILLTHKNDIDDYDALFTRVIENLEKSKYLVDTFAKGNKKYNGVCKLKRHKTFRRIDLMYTQKKQYPFALLYFTGSQDFNIKLRSHAMEKGYSLNEYGLKYISGDNKGNLVDMNFETEEDVLNFLGLRYIEPIERKQNIDLEQYQL